MHKDGLKTFPLTRYVVERDGDGNVLCIVTKELISRKVLDIDLPEPEPNSVVDDSHSVADDVTGVYAVTGISGLSTMTTPTLA